jgi:hypothetical protein
MLPHKQLARIDFWRSGRDRTLNPKPKSTSRIVQKKYAAFED